jgi:hypothetical protein
MRLPYLLRRLMEIREHPHGGPFRIRLSSIEATEVTRELLDVMAEHADRICPHLHVSMQSGSDGVLRRMHRRWGAQRFVDRCKLAQTTLDLPALTTDIIVGFPGETDDEFVETCEVVRELEFSKLHIFPFSARRSTPAATMPNQVAPPVKAARCEQLKQIEKATQQAYFRRLAGKRLDVLVQSPVRGRAGRMWGTACRYASVELAGGLDLDSQLVPVIAGAPRAEVEVRSFDHRPGGETLDNERAEKVVGGKLQQRAVGRIRDHRFDAEGGEQFCFTLRPGKRRRRFGRAEQADRVWIECENDRRPADCGSLLADRSDDPCVAPMDAVEIANRHGAAAEIVGPGCCVND